MTEFITLIGAAAPPGQQGQGGLAQMLFPMLIIFVIFYFLLIRPQQKKAKDHQGFLDSLEKGSDVITNGGLIGKITGLTTNIVTLEVAPKVRVKVTRASITGIAPKGSVEEEKTA